MLGQSYDSVSWPRFSNSQRSSSPLELTAKADAQPPGSFLAPTFARRPRSGKRADCALSVWGPIQPVPATLRAKIWAELEAQITELAGHLNAAQYRWLLLIAEFDRRYGWNDGATQTCAHWLNWKCGIDLGAAREKGRLPAEMGEQLIKALEAAVEDPEAEIDTEAESDTGDVSAETSSRPSWGAR